MLPIDSPHWNKLTRWTDNGASISDELEMLKAEIHTEHFEDYWTNFRDILICQSDISETAIAVVPHILALLQEIPIPKRLQIVYDIGWIVWLRSTVTSNSITPDIWDAFDRSLVDYRQEIGESLAGTHESTHYNLKLFLGAIAFIWGDDKLGKTLTEWE